MYIFSKSFSNLDGLRRYLDTASNSKLFEKTNDSKNGSSSFTGTESYSAANDLLRDGDAKNAAKLKAAAGNGLKAAAGDGQRIRHFSSVCGGAVNVPNMLMGLPKSMIAAQKVKYKDSKVVSMVFNASIDCTIEADEINKVSAYLVNAIMGLEKKGYRVNLYVMHASTRGSEKCAMFVRIKDSGQYMDVKKMAYPLVNPSMLRRHYFRFVETVPGLKDRSWLHTYGRPVMEKDKAADLAKEAGLNIKKIVSFYEVRNMTSPEMMRFILD